MILRGGLVLNSDYGYDLRDVYVDDDTGLISDRASGDAVDCSGKKILPGFSDTHIHGFRGTDVSDADAEGIIKMALELPSAGVTSFCPTTMTLPYDRIYDVFSAVSRAKLYLDRCDDPHARILGVHLEGPFLTGDGGNIQRPEYMRKPSEGYELIDKLESDFPGLLKIIDVAPELEGSMEFIRHYSSRYIISIAHSRCDYETASEAIFNGVSSVTHILNAMTPIDKRSPGIACAAFDHGCYAEIICDGIHIEAPVLRMLFKTIDIDHTIVISDSMRGAGMPDGDYRLGDAMVRCEKGRTWYGASGSLAGSLTDLFSEYKILTSSGIPEPQVIRSLTVNPLRRLGMPGGTITQGLPADLIVTDGNLPLVTYCMGKGKLCYNCL
ncbi:MAG: amidohydrolase family protein [Clostridiales bacterium]|nr:amidohydrolase family protein [Clostridiales bacterium]